MVERNRLHFQMQFEMSYRIDKIKFVNITRYLGKFTHGNENEN